MELNCCEKDCTLKLYTCGFKFCTVICYGYFKLFRSSYLMELLSVGHSVSAKTLTIAASKQTHPPQESIQTRGPVNLAVSHHANKLIKCMKT